MSILFNTGTAAIPMITTGIVASLFVWHSQKGPHPDALIGSGLGTKSVPAAKDILTKISV